MKNNGPVTQVERPLPEGQYLVSKTDLKGIITYANDPFIEISGFTREEMIGKSHNIVRHPDMPAQAFADLWRTLKSGYPWQGLVKNRCKNGDYYWVKALVVPIDKGHERVGYMSVRSQPSRDEVAQAEAAYRRLLADPRRSFSTEPGRWERISFRQRLAGLVSLAMLAIIAGSLIALNALQATHKDIEAAYDDHLAPGLAIAEMVEKMGDNRAQIMLGLQHSPDNRYHTQHDHPTQMHIDATLANRARIEALRSIYAAKPKRAEEQALADAFMAARERFSQAGIQPARDALAKGDFDGAQRLLLEQINPLFREVAATAHALQSHLQAQGQQARQASEARNQQLRLMTIAGIVLLLALIGLGGFGLVRRMSRQMQQITRHFQKMAQGNLAETIDIRGRDEVGQMMTELARMQVSLKVMLDEVRTASEAIAQEGQRVAEQTANVLIQSAQQHDRAASVAAATEEFSQSILEVSDAANQTLAAANESQIEVVSARTSMDQSMIATGRVVDAVQRSSQTIEALNAAIAKIGDITTVIREIADQTNLLALNAAIEAARAGEAGRGFAVVADEVRKLAERTATSTRDIAQNVTEVRTVTDAAVASMNDAVHEVENGIGLIRASGEGLSRITHSSERVTTMAQDIAAATAEQVTSSQVVAQNMERVVQLVDGNVEAANEAKAAVDQLTHTAEKLNRIVGRFKVL